MKLSFCTIGFRHRKTALEDLIFILSKLGYDGIEIWGPHLNGYETSLDKISRILEQRGLKVCSLSPYFNFTDSYAKWVSSIAEAEKFIAFAIELGCPFIRCFTGEVGSKWATEKQWDDGVSGIREIAGLAKKAGITIAIETHPNTLADTIPASLKLLHDIGMENVKFILDFYNLWEIDQKDPLEVLEELYPYTVHIHAKNADLGRGKISPFRYVMDANRALDSVRPLDNGDLDYKAILTELVRRKYQGYLSIECFETERNPLWVAEEELIYIKKVIERAG